MPTKLARFLAHGVIGLVVAALACGFAYIKNTATGLPIKWPPGSILMKVYPQNTTVLTDGNTEGSTLQAAMQDASRGWNPNLGDAQFTAQILAVGGSGMDNNNINEVFFSNTVFGMAFGSDGTLAVTTTWYEGNQRAEADVIFNTAYTWDSYRGNLRAATDLQRVALHEFGHVLGLDHPDDAGQTVAAVMNSHVSSSADSLTVDDIAGAQSLYGPPGVPANDNFAAAINFGGGTFINAFYNTNATKEPGEPNHAGNAGGRSVWWKWTAPSNGNVTLTTQGSVFDTTLGVYTGSAVNALATITSNDDVTQGTVQSSSVTFTATSGVTYYFAVDGFNANDGHGADSGAISLNLSFTSTGPTSTTTTIPPTPPLSGGGGGGGGGGGAPSTWFLGALSLLAGLRRMFPKKG